MKNNKLWIALAVLFTFTFSACVSVDAKKKVSLGGEYVTASGKVVSKNFNLAPFNSISVSGMQDIVITQGNTQSITVKASDNIMSYCDLSVGKGVLKIVASKEWRNTQIKKFDMVVYLTMKDVNTVTSNGTGDVKFKGNLSAKDLKLKVKGTGDITLPSFSSRSFDISLTGTGDVEAKGSATSAVISLSGTGDIDANLTLDSTLKCNLNGTGDVKLKGSVNNAEYNCSGTGDISAKNMKAKSVNANANGTGDIQCYASESFRGKSGLTSNIKCYGNPSNRNIKADGISFPK